MGNEGRSRGVGMRTLELNFTFGKKVSLGNVLRVPDMNRNLVSGDLLGKSGIYESGKLILTLNSVFLLREWLSFVLLRILSIMFLFMLI